MNVILVVFDSLRKDCIGIYGAPPWGEVKTPYLNALARDSLVFDRAYPESLPTLPARRAIYTGRCVYPFVDADFRLKGDFVGAPGWGPIPEDQATLAEMFQSAGYRTALISDVYHMFKPSKNYWRGFNQWTFLRGQEKDPYRSGPELSQQQIDHWLPKELQTEQRVAFIRQCLKNMHDRTQEEDYFNARVFAEAARWLDQNRDAQRFFLTVECFDPHEPWFVPERYRLMYDRSDGPEQVISTYSETWQMSRELLRRTQANYSALVTMCDGWFGFFYETLQNLGLLGTTLLLVTSDHGHSIGDNGYMGKRGYPSHPSVYDVLLFIRHPEGKGAGQRTGVIVQHQDLTAEMLRAGGMAPPAPIDGKPFFEEALLGREIRRHATIGWGAAVTVVTKDWFYNSKVDGTGPFLFALNDDPACGHNEADSNPDLVQQLYTLALRDAGGNYPDYLLRIARTHKDAPGCSALVARPV